MKAKTLAMLVGVSAPLILSGSTDAGFVGIETVSKPNPFGLFVVLVRPFRPSSRARARPALLQSPYSARGRPCHKVRTCVAARSAGGGPYNEMGQRVGAALPAD